MQCTDSYSPDHMYSYPYDDSWINNGEQCYDSDSDLWFGKELKKLSKRCKRFSRNSKKLHAQKSLENEEVTSKNKRSESSNEGTAVKVTKPRASPRLLKPEARPRKFCKQDVSSSHVNTDGLNVDPMKSSNRDQCRYVHATYM